MARLASCFEDGRNPTYISHSVLELISQRVYGLALGYEDLSDHDQLRQDPDHSEKDVDFNGIQLSDAGGFRSSMAAVKVLSAKMGLARPSKD